MIYKDVAGFNFPVTVLVDPQCWGDRNSDSSFTSAAFARCEFCVSHPTKLRCEIRQKKGQIKGNKMHI